MDTLIDSAEYYFHYNFNHSEEELERSRTLPLFQASDSVRLLKSGDYSARAFEIKQPLKESYLAGYLYAKKDGKLEVKGFFYEPFQVIEKE